MKSYFYGMKLYRYITLTGSGKLSISDGIKNDETHHFRERCRAIDLSDKGQTVPQIAFFLENAVKRYVIGSINGKKTDFQA
ncbi:MAG: hypothetical protein RLZZ292_4016 [Bacteroidota bacterium]